MALTDKLGTVQSYLGNMQFAILSGGGLLPSTITVTSGDKVYDASPYSPSVSTTGSSGSVTYTYYSAPNAGGSVISAPTNVGSYSVIADLASDGTYAAATSPTKNFDITKANSTITVTSGDKVYDGSPYSPSVSNTGSSGLITYTYYLAPNAGGSVIAAPTNAGSYSVIAHVAADSNYNGADSPTKNFDITKAASSIVITSGDKTYDGIAYSATSSHLGSSGAITYTYYDGPGGTGSVIAAPTNAGSYSVIANLAADSNYNSAVSPADDFNINKANSSITVTSGDKAYDGLPYSPTVSTSGSSGAVTYTFYDGPGGTGSVIPAPTAGGSYSVIAHLAADTNYNSADSPAKDFAIIGGGAIAVLMMAVRHELRGGLQ